MKYYQQAIAGTALVTVALYVLYKGTEIIQESQNTVPFSGPHWKHKDKTVESSELFNSKYLRLESHTVRSRAGLINGWIWVDFHDQINVLARGANGKFYVLRQVKYGLPGPSLSVVCSAIAPNEQPRSVAERELLDELGMVASKWIFLGKFRTDSNRGGGFVYSFLALDVVRKGSGALPLSANELETQEVIEMNHVELMRALLGNEFAEAKWANTVAMGLLHLSTKNAPSLPLSAAETPLNQKG